jgi:NAD(P)-dependent dehydrogenase (short-subunit alcohol dehydrogenase family)
MTNASPRSVLVPGGTGGLGRAVVQRLLGDGYRCIVVYRTPDKWQTLQQEVQHNQLYGIQADLADEAAVQQAVQQARDIGGLYALVHLAGGFEGGSVAETSLDTWNRLLATNLTSAFIVARAVLPYLKEAGAGRIVTIGSSAVPKRPAGVAAYTVSKAALAALTEVLANELAKTKITANILLAGSLGTPAMRQSTSPDKLVPLERVAATIAFLLSDEAASITGASIPVSVTGTAE